MSESVKRQFTKTRPGVLCVQFIDLTNEQIRRLGTPDDNQTAVPTALLVRTSKFLSDAKRAHIHAIAFRGYGEIKRESTVAGNIQTSVIREEGNAYVISNDYHPLIKDRRYAVFPDEKDRGSRLLVIRSSRKKSTL